MKPFLSFLLTFLFPLSLVAESIQHIELSIDGLSDARVKAAARTQAAIQAMEELPSVVWGTEKIQNQVYRQDIDAVSFAYTDIEVLKESFDRQSDMYSLTAKVSWNEDKIFTVLKSVADGEKAKQMLANLRKLATPSAIDRYLESSHGPTLAPLQEAAILIDPLFYSESYDKYHDRVMAMTNHLASLLRNQRLALAQRIRLSLSKVLVHSMEFVLEKPSSKPGLSFTDERLSDFYEQNEGLISQLAGNLCLFSTTQNAVYKMEALNQPDALTFEFSLDTQRITRAHANALFDRAMMPFDVLLCDRMSYDKARSISSHAF